MINCMACLARQAYSSHIERILEKEDKELTEAGVTHQTLFAAVVHGHAAAFFLCDMTFDETSGCCRSLVRFPRTWTLEEWNARGPN